MQTPGHLTWARAVLAAAWWTSSCAAPQPGPAAGARPVPLASDQSPEPAPLPEPAPAHHFLPSASSPSSSSSALAPSARQPWPYALAPGYSPSAPPRGSAERQAWPTPVYESTDAGTPANGGQSPSGVSAVVVIDTVQVDGPWSVQQASSIVMSLQGRLAGCYHAALALDRSVKGSIVLRMVVGSNGSVVKVARGATDLFDPKLMQCLMRSNEVLRFPVPATGAGSVGYRVVLSPG